MEIFQLLLLFSWPFIRQVNLHESKNKKKIILFIVEGPSDETALSRLLEEIFDQKKIFTFVTHGDVTSNSQVENIVHEIADITKRFKNRNDFDFPKSPQIKSIVLLSDTDGCFIPDQNIIEDSRCDKFYYDSDQDRIIAKNRKDVIERNHQKSKNMDILIGKNSIKNLPFHIYYMSCNLDHVLHNFLNLDDDDKAELAQRFALSHEGNPLGFIQNILTNST